LDGPTARDLHLGEQQRGQHHLDLVLGAQLVEVGLARIGALALLEEADDAVLDLVEGRDGLALGLRLAAVVDLLDLRRRRLGRSWLVTSRSISLSGVSPSVLAFFSSSRSSTSWFSVSERSS
jgi:hypothetical protein